ncbi:hypothetical protein SERLADRAFT_455812, partial [Serpula lacrymans var. lacrymans S7.9]
VRFNPWIFFSQDEFGLTNCGRASLVLRVWVIITLGTAAITTLFFKTTSATIFSPQRDKLVSTSGSVTGGQLSPNFPGICLRTLSICKLAELDRSSNYPHRST